MHRITTLPTTTLALTLASLATLPAFAHGEEGDFGLLNINGVLTPAIINDETGEITSIGNRVLGTEFQQLIPGTVAIDEPGFFFAEGEFASGAILTYTHRGPIRRWTGTDFSGLASDVNTDIGFTDGSTTEFAPSSGTAASLFEYSYNGIGDFDEHPDYLLTGDQAEGIYLWEFELVMSNDPSLSTATTAPLFLVFNFGIDDAIFDEALDYTADVLVPAPGAVAAFGLVTLAGVRRRR